MVIPFGSILEVPSLFVFCHIEMGKGINILIFGQLTEITGNNNLLISDVSSTNELNKTLKSMFPELQKATFSIALNRKIVQQNTLLKDEDEVCLLPPFSGG